MKVAILGDIHGNLEALEAVLIAIGRERIDDIVCLGDIVGYGPDPLGCIYRLREVRAQIVMGNHDQAILHPDTIRSFNSTVRNSLIYSRQVLSEEEIRFLGELPLSIEGQGEMADIVFSHANPQRPEEWEPLFMHQKITHFMGDMANKMSFVGHTHHAGIYCKMRARAVPLTSSIVAIGPHQYLVNPGSVGQPRDGDWRAAYAILDTQQSRVELHRVEYAVKRTQEKMDELEFPHFTIERLSKGE